MEKIITGKTVEEALDRAASELGISKDDFKSYEILEQPAKGFLGFGSKEAKVKVEYDVLPEQYIKEFLTGLFEKMNLNDYTMDVQRHDMKIDIQVTGEDVAFLTAKRGEAVEALQLMLALTVGKYCEGHYNLSFNVNDYKEKCKERLEALAMKIAGQVSKTRKKSILNPMSAYQRRIIHSKLQDYKNITTYSIGEDPNRRVVIAYQYPAGETPRKKQQNTTTKIPGEKRRIDGTRTDGKINMEARTIGGRPFSPDILSPNHVPKLRTQQSKPYNKNNKNRNYNNKKETKPAEEAVKTEE